MNLYKKLAITLIIIITSYLLYGLYLKRVAMIDGKEGLTLFPVKVSLGNFDANAIVTSKTLKNIQSAIAIKQYAIKSSYQTAWDGYTISLDQIAYVLSRGVRYLDFDVFWDKPTPKDSKLSNTSTKASFTAVVSHTIDFADPSYSTTGTVKLALADVLGFLSQYAFSKTNIPNSKNAIYNTPNPKDPLFIQLHVKYMDPTKESGGVNYRANLYHSVAGALATSFTTAQSNVLVNHKLNSSSSLADLMGQVVFVFDNAIYPDYLQYTKCMNTPSFPNGIDDAASEPSCYQLSNYINILTSSNDMQVIGYGNQSTIKKSPITIPTDSSETNGGYTVRTNILMQFAPINERGGEMKANIDSFNATQTFTSQIVGMMYWNDDGNLSDYEKLFNKLGSAFVPLSAVKQYIITNTI